MNGKVETSLKQLSSLSKSLNEASDELSKQISAIEAALNEFKLGVWAWANESVLTEIEYSEPDQKGQRLEIELVYQLGYGKHQGKWGLVVSYGPDWDDDPKIMFLRESPRQVRIKAIDRIPDLLDVLAQKLSGLTQEAAKKSVEAREIAAALSSKRSR